MNFLYRCGLKFQYSPASSRATQGFTLFELLVVIAVLGILFSIVALNVKGLNHDADNATSAVSASLIQARTTAISTTSSIRATLTNSTTLIFETNVGCTKTSGWTTVSNVAPILPDGVTITAIPSLAIPWSICFTNRGELITPAPAALKVTDNSQRTRTLNIYLTGSVGL